MTLKQANAEYKRTLRNLKDKAYKELKGNIDELKKDLTY